MPSEELLRLAKRYTWWLEPKTALEYPQRVIARVMDMGTFEDLHLLGEAVGEDSLRATLATADYQLRIRFVRYDRMLGHLQARLRRVALLVIDELGFVPFDRAGGELLFNLIARPLRAAPHHRDD